MGMPKTPSWHAAEFCRLRSCVKRTQQKFKKNNTAAWNAFCRSHVQPANWTHRTQNWGRKTQCSWPRKIRPNVLSFKELADLDKPFFKNVNGVFKKEIQACRLRLPQGGQPKIGPLGFVKRDVILECSWMLFGGTRRQNKKNPRVWWFEKSSAWIDTPLHLCCWLLHRREKKNAQTLLYKSLRRQADNAARRERWKTDPNFRKMLVDRRRLHRRNNIEKTRAYCRLYRKLRRQDPAIKLKQNARSRFGKVMKKVKAVQTTSSFNDFIGCSTQFLKEHIEKQFESWMAWDNYGISWNLDHKKPLNRFDLLDPYQANTAFHFSNLKPVSVEYNASKQDRWVDV